VRESRPNIFIHRDPRPCMAAFFETCVLSFTYSTCLNFKPTAQLLSRKGASPIRYADPPAALGIGGFQEIELAREDSKPEAVAAFHSFPLESMGESPTRAARAIGTYLSRRKVGLSEL
jgi:hypothetical protein